MTRDRFKKAMIAWQLAISSKIEDDNLKESYEDLARQFGKGITNDSDLEEVSECFNWDTIIDFLEKNNER